MAAFSSSSLSSFSPIDDASFAQINACLSDLNFEQAKVLAFSIIDSQNSQNSNLKTKIYALVQQNKTATAFAFDKKNELQIEEGKAVQARDYKQA